MCEEGYRLHKVLNEGGTTGNYCGTQIFYILNSNSIFKLYTSIFVNCSFFLIIIIIIIFF